MRGTGLTGSERLGVKGGAEDIEDFVLRIRYQIREPKAVVPGVKWPRHPQADGQHRRIVAVASGDLMLDFD
jgi:hypothetical protein